MIKNNGVKNSLLLLLLLGGAGSAQAEESKKNSSEAKQYTSRSAGKGESKNVEMEKLAFLTGSWNYTATHVKKDKNGKEEVETGKFISRFGPGKNSLIIELHGSSSQGEDVIMDLIGWDPETKSYETITTGSSFPTFMHGKAYWNKDLFTMEINSKRNNIPSQARIIYKRIRDNEMQVEEWFQRGAEPHKHSMTMKLSKA